MPITNMHYNVPTNGEFNKIHIYGHEIIKARRAVHAHQNGFFSFYGGEWSFSV